VRVMGRTAGGGPSGRTGARPSGSKWALTIPRAERLPRARPRHSGRPRSAGAARPARPAAGPRRGSHREHALRAGAGDGGTGRCNAWRRPPE
jgi:hypothetical protein